MEDYSQNKIDQQIQSLQKVGNVSYSRPQDNTKEFHNNLLKNQEALTYLIQERKLDLKTIEHFKLGLGDKGNLVIPIYKKGKLIDYKFRSLPPNPKKFSRFKGAETWIFNDVGIEEGKKKNGILLVEGEADAMSIWQAGIINVISLVGGAGHIGTWIHELADIDKIYINLDSDQAGQNAARKLAERIGIDKCINVKLPVKDANDFFKKYGRKEFENIIRNSKEFPVKDVSSLEDLYEDVKSNKYGKKDFKFYYPQLDNVTGGFNRGNVVVVSAETSHGKTSFMFNIATNLCKNDTPVLYVPLEDNPLYLARRMFNILSGVEVSRLDDKNWDFLKSKIQNFPFYFYMAQDKFNLQVFRKIIEEGKKIYNTEIFILDHLFFLCNRSSRDQNEEVSFLMRELVDIARSYNITIFLISHIRKKQGQGDWTKMPSMNELRSSGLVKGDAHMIMMLFKTKNNIGAPITQLAVQKNREGNTTSKYLEFEFDLETGIIKEHISTDTKYYQGKEYNDDTNIPDLI